MSVKKRHLRDGSTSISFVDKKGNDIDIAIFGDEIRFWKAGVLKGTLLYTQESINDSDIVATLTQIVADLIDEKHGADISRINNEILGLSQSILNEKYTRYVDDVELYQLIISEARDRSNGDISTLGKSIGIISTISNPPEDGVSRRYRITDTGLITWLPISSTKIKFNTPVTQLWSSLGLNFGGGMLFILDEDTQSAIRSASTTIQLAEAVSNAVNTSPDYTSVYVSGTDYIIVSLTSGQISTESDLTMNLIDDDGGHANFSQQFGTFVYKDDEIISTYADSTYTYQYNPIGSLYATQDQIDNLSGEIGSESLARTSGDNALQQQIDSLDTAMGNISSALDEILLIGGSI